jgi:hypothetical protein
MQVAQGGIDLWEHANRPCNDNGRGGCRGEISQKSSQICPRSRKGGGQHGGHQRLVKADPRLDQEKAAEVDTGERAPEKADETLTKAAEEALEATKAANFKAESEAWEKAANQAEAEAKEADAKAAEAATKAAAKETEEKVKAATKLPKEKAELEASVKAAKERLPLSQIPTKKQRCVQNGIK